jgi:hypothetical protein
MMDEEQMQAIIRIIWITTAATALILAGWLIYERVAASRRIVAPADDLLAEEPRAEPANTETPPEAAA